METRPFGRTGLRVTEIGICPGDGPEREAVLRRAFEKGCRLFASARPIEGAVTIPEGLPSGYGLVPYNLLDQKEANAEIARLSRAGVGVVATHVLAGGALAGKGGRGRRIEELRRLERPGRTLAQLAVQFVLANESVNCALVRTSTVAHLEEVLAAPDAPPLTGQDLEQIFELWANRFE